MIARHLQAFIDQYPVVGPWAIGAGAIVLSIVVFLIARFLIACGLMYVAGRTAKKFDDILVDKLRPYVDLNSVRFVDDGLIERLRKVDLVCDYMDDRLAEIERRNVDLGIMADTSIESPQLTNIQVFQAYVEQYLKSRTDLHQDMTPLVRQLGPGSDGLPVEVHGFTRSTDWAEYEAIQAEIVDHLLASLPWFDLRVFQEPTGFDLRVGGARLGC